jgi:predicted Mrr-cat superfamily restriction endonuclease
MWMVRADTGRRLVDELLEKKVIGIGWGGIGDLNKFKEKKAILKVFERIWPECSKGRHISSMRHYEELHMEGRSPLPLKKIYLPV